MIGLNKNTFKLPLIRYREYDKVIVWFSGGKDSVSLVLALLESGVPPEKIELHHHLVDGKQDIPDHMLPEHFMDWPITEAYCKAFAEAFGMEIYFSWREGGFEKEMLRNNDFTAPILFEDPDRNIITTKGSENPKFKNTRFLFPQQTASLSERWCSAYLKVDVGDRLIKKQVRFANGKKYLVLSGERAEESAARSKYKIFEAARSDNRNGKRVNRWIDHYRGVHQWQEWKVWELMKAYGVNPHPAYHLGWSRTSCLGCIFNGKNHLATLREYAKTQFDKIAAYEAQFGTTINRPAKKNGAGLSLNKMADKGIIFDVDKEMFDLALGHTYDEKIFVNQWQYPLGAFGDSSCGAA